MGAKEALAAISDSLKNPFTLRGFYTILPLLALFLLSSSIVVGKLTTSTLVCRDGTLHFSGKLEGSLARSFEFTYAGSPNCELVIIPDSTPKDALSLWVYKPDKTIQTLNGVFLTSSRILVFDSSLVGKYRISLHNNTAQNISYQISLASVPKKEASLAIK